MPFQQVRRSSEARVEMRHDHVVAKHENRTSKPQTALLARHQECGGPRVHPNTLAATLKAEGLVYKRTRHSLKKAAARPPSAKQP